ncbi:class 1 fructose-bisphosphatase [Halogranum rubrum]|uniref:Fructose-1,6-bisphosphatase class 1 n=1 Tax=Halogranum salarium B-1 TaxID=1210908 RepID=J3JD13_9EURY|nr:class 1 fructose-bisphosphatase [Halogranum salarium]EJN57089.1 fructose-1,6-bisphosphatase [Halogranum salarium B-1]
MTAVDSILTTVVDATTEIRAELATYRDKVDTENPTGDTQVAADQWIDDLLFERFRELDAVGSFVSEERPDAIDVGDGYSVAIDPLDGSSNLEPNSTTGTILGIYDAPLPASGRELVASAYVLYGSYTTMTVARDDTVERLVIQEGEVVDTDPVSMPSDPGICGVAGQTSDWDDALRTYVDELRETYKLRYSGAMVADVEQLLTYGGLLAYPPAPSQPDGILRLQFESNPIAHIVEAAGGRSSDGHGSVLDCDPKELHQCVPTYFGTPALVDELETRL